MVTISESGIKCSPSKYPITIDVFGNEITLRQNKNTVHSVTIGNVSMHNGRWTMSQPVFTRPPKFKYKWVKSASGQFEITSLYCDRCNVVYVDDHLFGRNLKLFLTNNTELNLMEKHDFDNLEIVCRWSTLGLGENITTKNLKISGNLGKIDGASIIVSDNYEQNGSIKGSIIETSRPRLL